MPIGRALGSFRPKSGLCIPISDYVDRYAGDARIGERLSAGKLKPCGTSRRADISPTALRLFKPRSRQGRA
jgi:hypothetical protein